MTRNADEAYIFRLPDEVLAKIFDKTAPIGARRETLAANRDIVQLSHVSSRFRLVAINSPQLWCVVSNQQNNELRRMFLTRSKVVELHIFLILLPGTDSTDYVDFLEDVLPLSARWQQFYFRTGALLTDYIRVLQKLSKICSGLILPRLTDMTLVFPNPTFWDTDGDGIEDYWRYQPDSELFHFYKTWVTPHLKRLRARNRVPLGTGSLQMEYCEVKLRSGCGSDWYTKELESLAMSFASLKVLTFCNGKDFSDADIPPLYLPQLEMLTLEYNRHDIEGFYRFLNALHMPSVKTVAFTLPPCRLAGFYNGCISADDCIKALLPPHKEFEWLQDLSLSVGESGIHGDDAPRIPASDEILASIFKLPKLNHLILDVPELRPTQSFGPIMPPLRTLTLRNNVHIDIDFVCAVIDGLRVGAESHTFECLTVDNCKKLNQRDFEMLLPNYKLEWVSRPGLQTDADHELTDSEPEYDYWANNHFEQPNELIRELFEDIELEIVD